MSEETGTSQKEHPEQESTKSEVPVQRESSSPGGFLAILIALVALGVASYPAYELYRQASSTTPDPAAERIGDLANKVADIEARLSAPREDKLDDRIAALSAEIAEREAERAKVLAGIAEQLESVRKTSSKEWIFAEVEYLVRMAVQRVLMENDPESALQLLQSADEIVGTTEGLTAHRLRESLAKDIAALSAVNSPDTQGIYLSLSALVSRVPVLQRSMPVYEAGSPATDDTAAAGAGPDSTLAAIGRSLERMVDRLSALVDFRREQVSVRPILPPEEEYFLRQNLVLKLQIAQMALLEGHQAVYETALKEAEAWVGTGFDVEDPATIAMQEKLRVLASTSIAVDLPDISGSLRSARATLGDFGQDDEQ